MSTSKISCRLVLAGVLALVACGGVAFRYAWATPGEGITSTNISGPVVLGSIAVKSESDINEVEIKTNGFSDVYAVRNTIAPGGHTGWHSHPGPSIISVVTDQATNYHDDDPIGTVYPAGTAFVDDGDHAHMIRNEGDTDLVLVAFQILPMGAPRRIDEPAP